MFEIRNLNKIYTQKSGKDVQVLKNINLTIGKAKITAIVGPSGSGKSTLSKCLSLLESPSSGELILDGVTLNTLTGKALQEQRQKIGLVFQSSALLKRRTAAENIALPLEFLGVVDQQIQTRVQYLLENVKLADKADLYPAQLSGGQQQRVGIARALALQPSIVIADEATSGLDPDSTQSILKLLTELRDDLGLSVILITHEMDVVRQIADEVAVLSHGEIVEKGHVLDLVLNPESDIGAKILPIQQPSHFVAGNTIISATYSSRDATPLNWLGRLATDLAIAPEIYASTVEEVSQHVVGKVIFGVPDHIFERHQLVISQRFDEWNIHHQLLQYPPVSSAINAA